jgi:ubiquinone/menaquinone biosynthesis C-methylase UbiE
MEVTSDVATGDDVLVHPVIHEIDWDAYASQYDLLATYNPSYRENIETLRSMLAGFNLPESPRVCDIGAGTGNFICAQAQDLPTGHFWHIDADEKMNEVAKRKYERAGVGSVEIHCCSATEATYPSEAFDLIICVNALYAIYPQEELLRRIRTWLKPGGVFFVIDFGRRTRMWDWAKYIFGHIYREKGLLECGRFLVNGLETIRQNRRGSQGQAEGVYWLHSTEEFGRVLDRNGYRVTELRTCYRGYCDLAVCQLAER